MPAWSLAAVDDRGVQLSSESLRGKPYLLDLWATWCSPCVDEMAGLHTAYNEINRRGKSAKQPEEVRRAKHPKIEFVALSFDDSPDAVREFREEQWPMPWHNLNVCEAEGAQLEEDWGIAGYPTLVLVNAEGVIVADTPQLRGERLLPTLRAHLASQ